MLTYDLRLPEHPDDGAPLVVLLHGRGSDRHDLLRLHPYLPAGTMLVTPDAPFPAAPWGYGPGAAWYLLESEGVPDESTFTESLDALDEFLSAVPAVLPTAPGPLVLGGFSQGGTMSMAYAMVHPGSVPGVINLSGFIPRHPRVSVTAQSVGGTRFFWGHGTADTAIPHALAVRGRSELVQAGADLTAHDYAMGHGVSPAELGDLSAWLLRGARSAVSRSGSP
jgi:phospholipase/carboxylesterase